MKEKKEVEYYDTVDIFHACYISIMTGSIPILIPQKPEKPQSVEVYFRFEKSLPVLEAAAEYSKPNSLFFRFAKTFKTLREQVIDRRNRIHENKPSQGVAGNE